MQERKTEIQTPKSYQKQHCHLHPKPECEVPIFSIFFTFKVTKALETSKFELHFFRDFKNCCFIHFSACGSPSFLQISTWVIQMMEGDNVGLDQPPFKRIPPEITIKILSRLPTKTCLNCKCVCRDWNHCIISNEFAHLRRSNVSLLFYGRFNMGRTNFLMLDHKFSNLDETANLNAGVDGMIRFNAEFQKEGKPFWNGLLSLVNACNGVICLINYMNWDPFIICNPLTSQIIYVEQTHMKFHLPCSYGLGCCPVSQQYKVLRFLGPHTRYISGFRSYVAEIQTVGTNVWRTIDIGDASIPDVLYLRAFLHGSLHWYSRKDNCVWSFHFGNENENFSRYAAPNDTKGCQEADVTVFESSLCLIQLTCPDHNDIWIMKDYGVGDSWVKQFVIRINCALITRFNHFGPLVRYDIGRMLIYSVVAPFGSSLRVYDDESATSETVKLLGISTFTAVTFNPKFSLLQV